MKIATMIVILLVPAFAIASGNAPKGETAKRVYTRTYTYS